MAKGRPKGSKNKVKGVEKIQHPANERIIMRPVVTEHTKYVNDEGILYEQKTFYSFKSRIPGKIYVPGDDGQTKIITGMSIRDDITPRERDAIISSGAYKDGYIVEWNVEDPTKVSSYNALNDIQMNKICEEYIKTSDRDKIYSYIRDMDSVFSLNIFKEKILEKNLPASILKYCEGRVSELEEIEEKKNEAPLSNTNVKE